MKFRILKSGFILICLFFQFGCYQKPVDPGHHPGSGKYYYVNEAVSDTAYTYMKSKSNDFTLYVSIEDAVYAITKYPHVDSFERTVIETDSWREIEDEIYVKGFSKDVVDVMYEACEILGECVFPYRNKYGYNRIIIIDSSINKKGYR